MIKVYNMPWIPFSFASKWKQIMVVLFGRKAIGNEDDTDPDSYAMFGYWYRGCLYVTEVGHE